MSNNRSRNNLPNKPKRRDPNQPLNGQIYAAVGQQNENGGRMPSLASCGRVPPPNRVFTHTFFNGNSGQHQQHPRTTHRPWNARNTENRDLPEVVFQSKRQRIRSECGNNSAQNTLDVSAIATGNAPPRSNVYRGNPNRSGGIPQQPSQVKSWRRRKSWGNNTKFSLLNMNCTQNPTQPDSSPIMEAKVRSEELSDLPGFSYDPTTKKYYKILPNAPGQPAGSTPKHLNKLKFEHIQTNVPLPPLVGLESAGSKAKPSGNSLLHHLQNLQIGRATFPSINAKRLIEEQRVRSIKQTSSYSFEVTDSLSDRFAGCQFLDISEDGRSLVGCWALGDQCIYGEDFFSSSSRVISYSLSIDSALAQKESARYYDAENLLDSNGRYSCNTYGLNFRSVDNMVDVESTLVDMCLAPADEDVTCVLYATANSYFHSTGYNQERIITRCMVHMRPVEFNLTEEGRESMHSPVYNTEWITETPIWSLSFNSNDMKICIGMERAATIFNILSERSYKVSSGGKNVISSAFTKDGTSLLLGRRNASTSLLDLRLTSNHVIGELDSPSTCSIRQMTHRPNLVLTENFGGKIKIWDLRTMRCVTEFHGHKNSSHKLPCFVDANEQFIFAVGEDAVVRGWSLATNDQLCAVKTFPRAAGQNANSSMDFPRVVYSDRLGGLGGNPALVIAVNGDLLVHELPQ